MVQIFKSCISLWADSVIPMHWYGLIHSIERCCKIVLQNFKELDRGITNYKFGSTRNWSFQLMETTKIRIELWSSYKMFHNLTSFFQLLRYYFSLHQVCHSYCFMQETKTHPCKFCPRKSIQVLCSLWFCAPPQWLMEGWTWILLWL